MEPSATPPPCPCRTAGCATTSRRRAPTARTTSSPACADPAVGTVHPGLTHRVGVALHEAGHRRGALGERAAALRVEPVAEVLPGELAEQPDVVGVARDQLLPADRVEAGTVRVPVVAQQAE